MPKYMIKNSNKCVFLKFHYHGNKIFLTELLNSLRSQSEGCTCDGSR